LQIEDRTMDGSHGIADRTAGSEEGQAPALGSSATID